MALVAVSTASIQMSRAVRYRRQVAFMVAILVSAVATCIVNVYPQHLCRVTVAAFAAPKQQGRQSPASPGGNRKKKPLKIGGNENWYNKRKAGVKVQSRGPKPPKWEKEGDDLYVNNNMIQNGSKMGDSNTAPSKTPIYKKDMSYEEARALLRPFEGKVSAGKIAVIEPTTKAPSSNDNNIDKPFLWGGLSVGPVWKSRLINAGFPKPTPIQVASYDTLSNKKNQTSINGNAVIAASTGSGKSLAYLLPFLTSIDTNNRKKKTKQRRKNDENANTEQSISAESVTSALGKIWIVTPTMELAYQLQRTVDKVVAGDEGESTSNSDVLHVVEYKRRASASKELPEQESSFSVPFPILSDIIDRYYMNDSSILSQEPTFLAGTPKLFVQLRKEIKKILASTNKLNSKIRYAKQRQARRLREASEGVEPNDDEQGHDNQEGNIEEQLLYRKVALTIDNNLETLILDEVDRLLQTTTAMTRREHKTTKPLAQELLEALVWESKKKPFSQNSPGRRNGGSTSFSPSSYSSNLQIVCASATIGRSLRRQLMYITKAPSMDKAAVLITADVRTKKNAELRKASLLPSNLKHSYQIVSSKSERNENAALAASAATLQALTATLQSQSPQAPSLVFPGTIGVETVRDHLLNFGFCDVRGLSSLRSASKGVDSSNEFDSSGLNTPVYVVKERLARGLDLPEVRRVILLGVPSNAAAYAHLAGRTARQNTPGECTVLSKPSDAPKLVSIAKTLGLYNWKNLQQENSIPSKSEIESEDDGVKWDLEIMTKTAVKNKKVPELREFLESQGVSTKGLLKDSLVDEVLKLKDGS